MELTLSIPDEVILNVVKGIMDNMPECSLSMDCTVWKYDSMLFKFRDYEDGQLFTLNKDKLLATFPLLFTDKWPKGLIPPPTSPSWEVWEQWLCNSDASSFDAFVQLACFGEVIYG